MIVILTEKLGAQIQLFDSIEQEATAIKRVVNTVEDILNGKEQEGLLLTKPYSSYCICTKEMFPFSRKKQLVFVMIYLPLNCLQLLD